MGRDQHPCDRRVRRSRPCRVRPPPALTRRRSTLATPAEDKARRLHQLLQRLGYADHVKKVHAEAPGARRASLSGSRRLSLTGAAALGAAMPAADAFRWIYEMREAAPFWDWLASLELDAADVILTPEEERAYAELVATGFVEEHNYAHSDDHLRRRCGGCGRLHG